MLKIPSQHWFGSHFNIRWYSKEILFEINLQWQINTCKIKNSSMTSMLQANGSKYWNQCLLSNQTSNITCVILWLCLRICHRIKLFTAKKCTCKIFWHELHMSEMVSFKKNKKMPFLEYQWHLAFSCPTYILTFCCCNKKMCAHDALSPRYPMPTGTKRG